jgi:hypothetical protein
VCVSDVEERTSQGHCSLSSNNNRYQLVVAPHTTIDTTPKLIAATDTDHGNTISKHLKAKVVVVVLVVVKGYIYF